jgi:hypothetical protein
MELNLTEMKRKSNVIFQKTSTFKQLRRITERRKGLLNKTH